jgi:hypothetical protein
VSYTGPKPETDVPPWMEQTYEIHFRDPRQLFLNMLANPTFAEDFDYTPMRIFDIMEVDDMSISCLATGLGSRR